MRFARTANLLALGLHLDLRLRDADVFCLLLGRGSMHGFARATLLGPSSNEHFAIGFLRGDRLQELFFVDLLVCI